MSTIPLISQLGFKSPVSFDGGGNLPSNTCTAIVRRQDFIEVQNWFKATFLQAQLTAKEKSVTRLMGKPSDFLPLQEQAQHLAVLKTAMTALIATFMGQRVVIRKEPKPTYHD